MINVGVLRGGPSSEYEVSLNSGGNVLKHLPHEKYRAHDIYITKDGTWHLHGLPIRPHEALKHVDVVFNAMHGEYGEDGKVQQLLEMHGVPFTGSDSFNSSLAWNKVLSKKAYKTAGLKTPLYKTLTEEDNNHEDLFKFWRTFPIPVVVKPVGAGSSVGVTVVKNFDQLGQAVTQALAHGESVLVEEYIPGVEATCGVVENWRGDKLHALMPIEIRPRMSHFFDYKSKYEPGGSDEIVPGNFSEADKRALEAMAKKAHEVLGQRHYSRSDFMVHPRRGIYILETNSLPGLTQESLLPKALHAAGATLGQFLDHVIELAREGR